MALLPLLLFTTWVTESEQRLSKGTSAGLSYCRSQLNLRSLPSIHGSVHLRSLALLVKIALLPLTFQKLKIVLVLRVVTQLHLQMEFCDMRPFSRKKRFPFKILGAVFSCSRLQVFLLKEPAMSSVMYVCSLRFDWNEIVRIYGKAFGEKTFAAM